MSALRRALLAFVIAAASASGVLAAGRALTLDDRLAAQRAIEEVYWRHRTWPEANPSPKPSFAASVPDALVRAKVEDSLRKSSALEARWGRRITAADLQAELDRMARDSRAPDVLRELFEALGDDPTLIAETLARAALVNRRVRADETAGMSLTADPAVAAGTIDLPAVGDTSCVNDTWKPTFLDVPDCRFNHTAVWTGSEMIVWGGTAGQLDAKDTGGRYDPATDTWTATTIMGALPRARYDHTAVWTGTEMIVWGGRPGNGTSGYVNTGARYNPVTDTWSLTSTVGAPDARVDHTAVWTGTEMIVWGGGANTSYIVNSGARYDPTTDTWHPTSTTAGVPPPRRSHTAVWTGSRMLVWGGDEGGIQGGDGAAYDPDADAWTPMSTVGSPQGRYLHSAVWTGSRMIVWGGGTTPLLNSGGRYDPSTDTWTPTSTGTGVPAARFLHLAVWSGTEMIVWGGALSNGASNFTVTGGRYDPATDTWRPTSVGPNVPTKRGRAAGIWSGSELLVWGGQDWQSQSLCPGPGGRYDPVSDTWATVSNASVVPAGAWQPAEVWTGSELIVWGGTDDHYQYVAAGARYDPATDSWTPTGQGAGTPADGVAAVWSGTEMLVLGAAGGAGGRYDPAADTWRPLPASGIATLARPVWSGTEVLLWGGGSSLNAGARYNPLTNAWLPTSTGAGVPSSRTNPLVVWAGSEMIVWGGSLTNSVTHVTQYFNTGSRYNPLTNAWAPMSTGANVPAARAFSRGVWTGTELIVWGGSNGSGTLGTGSRYNPSTNTWVPIPPGPTARSGHAAVWTGVDMIVWGGVSMGVFDPAGGRYAPATDSWTPTSTAEAVPQLRDMPATAWTGREMIFWAGDYYPFTKTGALYCACPNGRLIYRDADGDGYGDPAMSRPSCDGNAVAGYVASHLDCADGAAAIHPGAAEVCNGIDDDCDGVVDGDDADLDGVTAACDVCAADYDPAQSDADQDGEGDACDLDDGVIYLRAPDRDHLAWQAELGPTSWNVYEGSLSVLRSSGSYTQAPGSNPLAQKSCGLADPFVSDLEAVPSGAVKFALVTGVTGGGEGSLGTNSAGAPRANINPCP